MIRNDDATIEGRTDDTLHNVIDMNSNAGHLLIDADTELAIRAPKIAIGTVSHGDDSSSDLLEGLNSSASYITNVSKNMNYGSGHQKTQEVTVGGVFCTLPVYLNVTYAGSGVRNGFVVSSLPATVETI